MEIYKDLVSIIMPCYNAMLYIGQAIDSVLEQTYDTWELLVVDDCSTDDSAKIIRSYCDKDKRVHYYKTESPSGGPTVPRNLAIKNAQGRFIAFLDSDDIWLPKKLEQQFEFFESERTAIVYSNYEKITKNGRRDNRVIIAPSTINYKQCLKENVIGCLTGVYDTKKTGKVYFQKTGHEDYVLWLSILKMGYIAQNTNTITALYRVQKKSLSGNKLQAAKWTWNIYRNIEKLNLIESLYNFAHYCIRSGIKFLR